MYCKNTLLLTCTSDVELSSAIILLKILRRPIQEGEDVAKQNLLSISNSLRKKPHLMPSFPIYRYAFICVYVCIYLCVHIYVYYNICVCVYVRVFVCVCASMAIYGHTRCRPACINRVISSVKHAPLIGLPLIKNLIEPQPQIGRAS